MRNNFKDYGFEADFEGEILKEIKDHNGTHFLGIIKDLANYDMVVIWASDSDEPKGYCYDNNCYNLIPIKIEWYKDKDSLNKAFYDIVTKNIVIISWLDFKGNVRVSGDLNTYKHERFRPATKQEVDSLYYNKE